MNVKENSRLREATETSMLSSAELDAELALKSQLSLATQVVYNELAEIPVQETDVLDQLEQNIATLENLRAKFNFVVREIRYQMKV